MGQHLGSCCLLWGTNLTNESLTIQIDNYTHVRQWHLITELQNLKTFFVLISQRCCELVNSFRRIED